ncbi:MAG: amino acid permease [Verrucomicrobiales bacterium]|nr:amino acid permease [Verrucomicrobiales bacterium]
MQDSQKPTVSLRRSLSLPLLTFYGIGTILGAGIYVLIGEVAAESGMHSPIAFLVAAIVAGFTAFSYAELSSRIPRSAGEAAYVSAGLKSQVLAGIAGWGVVATGIVSAATIANGFVGYLDEFFPAQRELTICIAVLILGVIAAWGVRTSVAAASVITVIEIGGLVFVIALAGHNFAALPDRLPEMVPDVSLVHATGIVAGAYLAFFAFIGFEDIVNMAEETVEPRKTVPRAIIISLFVSTTLYILVAVVATLALPLDELAGAKAPLARIVEERGPKARATISLVSLVAVINGALIQIIMASRVLYGMAKQGLAPQFFSRVHRLRRTPIRATAFTTGVAWIFALGLPLVTLAILTSTVTLTVFALVNLALLRLKIREGEDCESKVSYPIWVPATGCILCVGLLILQWVL